MKQKKSVKSKSKIKKRKIKTIVFDVGGVLALEKATPIKNGNLVPFGVHLDVSQKLKMPLDKYFEAIDTVFAESVEGEISEKKTLSILSKKLGVSEKKIYIIYAWAHKRHFKQNKELHKKAIELKKLGYQIVVLSDQWHLSKKTVMPKKLYKKFTEKIISCDVGMRKPDPRIYKVVLKKTNSKPEETIFIDNREWNLPPAKKIGIKTIQFQDNKQLFQNKTWKKLFE